jgi:RNA polymerase sigma-70 factor (ECF subfamily)
VGVEKLADWSDTIDSDLLAVGLAGDERAFEELYRRYDFRLTVFLQNFGIVGQDAEDIIQNTWIRVFQHGNTFDSSRSKFNNWIYLICKRLAINTKRDWKRQAIPATNLSTMGGEGYFESFPSSGKLPDEICEINERFERILSIMDEYDTVGMRMLKKRAAGFTYNELQQEENIPLGTVKSKLVRSRALMVEADYEKGSI